MIVNVTNRSAGIVGYTIPEMSVRRSFQPGETKKLDKEELVKLQYQPGGLYLLMNYLRVNEEAVQELEMDVEPEFYLDEKGVKELMLNGSLDEFLDALDFAPKGVIEMFKDLSVKLPLADANKIEALKEKTGFDASVALKNLKATQEKVEEEKKERRTNANSDAAAPKRRVDESKKSKYTVIG